MFDGQGRVAFCKETPGFEQKFLRTVPTKENRAFLGLLLVDAVRCFYYPAAAPSGQSVILDLRDAHQATQQSAQAVLREESTV